MPYIIPDAVAHPAIEFLELAINTPNSEIVKPPLGSLFELLDAFIEGHGYGFAGDGLKSELQKQYRSELTGNLNYGFTF
jgi:hypothetical protein